MWRWAIALLAVGGCRSTEEAAPISRPAPAQGREVAHEADASDPTAGPRAGLVRVLRAQGIEDERVLRAIGRVPRHELVPRSLRARAYFDQPLPIGAGQTISQPYVVALMSELIEVEEGDRVLEVGTGSGYQAAVLAELTEKVFTIEIVVSLAEQARRSLERLGYADRISFRVGDGYAGWPEMAPFDAIIVTAAPSSVPPPLLEQLGMGGRMVIPVGSSGEPQELRLLERTPGGINERAIIGVRFVPMSGRAERDR